MISFSKNHDFYLFIWKFAWTTELFVVSVENVFCFIFPVTGLRQLLDLLSIFIDIILIKFCGKNDETILFGTFDQILENFNRQITVVDQTWAYYEIKSIDKFVLATRVRNSKNLPVNLTIDLFGICCWKFCTAAVDAVNVVKAIFAEVLTDISVSAADVQDFAFEFLFFRCHFVDQFSAYFGWKPRLKKQLLIHFRFFIEFDFQSFLRKHGVSFISFVLASNFFILIG